MLGWKFNKFGAGLGPILKRRTFKSIFVFDSNSMDYHDSDTDLKIEKVRITTIDIETEGGLREN